MNQQPTTKHRGQTGPKTEEGKKRSSLNALKHGLRAVAQHALAAADDVSPIDFQPYLDQAREYYQPADLIEDKLVERIARCLWRLDRVADMDRRAYERCPGLTRPGHTDTTIITYERLIDMQLHRALKAMARKNPHTPPFYLRMNRTDRFSPSEEWRQREMARRTELAESTTSTPSISSTPAES